MSLDTVLQIGKSFRNSENNLKYFKYVERCPQDKDGKWPICITISVNEDFSFDWGSIRLTPENQRKQLYYLKFKTSDSDSSANKFLFGDIYYVRKTDVDKNGNIKKINDFGNFTLERGNAFENGSKPFDEIINMHCCKILQTSLNVIDDSKIKAKIQKTVLNVFNEKQPIESLEKLKKHQKFAEDLLKELKENFQSNLLIKFHDAFGENIQYFNLLMKYAPAFESIIIDRDNVLNFLDNKESIEEKYIRCVFKNDGSIAKRFMQKDETIDNLSNMTKSQILRYANFSVFIHFDFQNTQWYQLEEPFTLLKEKLNSELTRRTERGLVPDAYIYRTLCSGNDKNDIQFPNFKIDDSYKSFAFKTENEFTDFLYTGKILNKSFRRLYQTKIDMFVFPVAFNDNKISAEEYDSFFFDKKNENMLQQSDPLFSLLGIEAAERFNRFDFVLSDSSGNATNDLIEISGIEKSSLKHIRERIEKKSLELSRERQNLLHSDERLSLGIEKSFLNVLGTYSLNKSGYLEPTENHRYKSHLLKTLPLIYMQNYVYDNILLSAFIKNVENIIRIVDEKSSGYQYNKLRYDLEFLYAIQNLKTNFMEEIKDSKSFKIGVLLGKLAKPLKKTINSFEKKYVGLLTRHISTKDNCISFVNEISEMLIRQEKMYGGQRITEIIEGLLDISNSEYDKEKLAFGFFEGYFKYEANDEKKHFVEKIEKIIADYENKENFQDEVDVLKNTIEEIK